MTCSISRLTLVFSPFLKSTPTLVLITYPIITRPSLVFTAWSISFMRYRSVFAISYLKFCFSIDALSHNHSSIISTYNHMLPLCFLRQSLSFLRSPTFVLMPCAIFTLPSLVFMAYSTSFTCYLTVFSSSPLNFSYLCVDALSHFYTSILSVYGGHSRATLEFSPALKSPSLTFVLMP